MVTNTTTAKGARAEKFAQHYLEKQNLVLQAQNYRCQQGEIDLVMVDKLNNELVFIEVRSRTPKGFGSAIETISTSKQRRIIKTAEHYLVTNEISHKQFCRFDVIGIKTENKQTEITWLPNAFEMEI